MSYAKPAVVISVRKRRRALGRRQSSEAVQMPFEIKRAYDPEVNQALVLLAALRGRPMRAIRMKRPKKT